MYLDLETLEHVKSLFDFHSDHSTTCNGYNNLKSLIDDSKDLKSNLGWSEIAEPNENCSYTHIISDTTPIGYFRIEWEGWKEKPSYCLWVCNEYHDTYLTPEYGGLDDIKRIASEHLLMEFNKLKKYLQDAE